MMFPQWPEYEFKKFKKTDSDLLIMICRTEVNGVLFSAWAGITDSEEKDKAAALECLKQSIVSTDLTEAQGATEMKLRRSLPIHLEEGIEEGIYESVDNRTDSLKTHLT